jgi:ATP synthase I chain
MTRSAEPERQLVRRALPFAPPAVGLAFLGGWLAGGADVAWSAALGVAIVAANFAVSGLSLAWAAKVSLTAIAAVVMGGFVVRMAVIVAVMFVLDRLTGWFDPLAFGLAVVPATLLLLGYEMKLLAGGVGGELIIPAERRAS